MSLKSSIVAYYKFDETSGTTAVDSKNWYNWTTTNVSWASWFRNNWASFAGNGYIILPNIWAFDITTGTWNFLVKNPTTTSNIWWASETCAALFDHRDETTGSWAYAGLKLWFGTDWVNKFRATVLISNWSSWNLTRHIVDWGISDTNTHMLTFTLTGTTTKIYFDNVLISTKTDHSSVNYWTNPAIYIWCNHKEYTWANTDSFTWMLDETSIYNEVLSDSERTKLWDNGNILSYPFLDPLKKWEYTPTANTKLLLHCNGDVVDYSWNWVVCTPTSVVYWNGIIWQWAVFNGSAYITLTWWIAISTDIFISSYIKKVNNTGYQILIWDANVWFNVYWYVWQNWDKLQFAWSNWTWNYRVYESTNSVIWTKLMQIAISQSGVSAPAMYINGISIPVSLVATAWVDTKPSLQWTSIWRPWLYNGRYFNWTADEIIVENTTKTAQQVFDNYLKSKTKNFWEYLWAGDWITKLLLHLNWNSTDYSWNGADWVDVSVDYVDWNIGQCAVFNARTDSIKGTLVSPPSWASVSTTVIMINPSSFVAWYESVRHVWNFASNQMRNLSFVNNGALIMSQHWWSSPEFFRCTAGTWYHIVVVYNGSAFLTYINTVLVNTWNYAINTQWTGYAIWQTLANTDWFKWKAKEFIYENVMRTQAQINKNYTQMKWRFWIL